jgi:hypothetical protein
MSNSAEFPAPYRLNGRLMWDRYQIENYKLALMGRAPLERDPSAPIVFVTAKQLTAELPYGRRSLGRRVKGRVQDAAAAGSVGTAIA